jgi:hypothetical protein
MQIIPIIGVALSAIGTGVAYYGQQQAAKTQETFALLNAQAGQAQAQMQSRLATANAAFEAQKTSNEQQAAQVTAAGLRDEAEQRTRAGQINIARQQEDQARFRSMLLARAGKSGTVAGTGSSLDILASAAELQALENAESHYQTQIQRRQLFREAEGVERGADFLGIQREINIMEGEARAGAYRAQGVQAQLQGLAGVQAARGASMGALGGALGGFGGLASNTYRDWRLGVFRSTYA